eukprot:1224956-Amphidinium_carterae.1
MSTHPDEGKTVTQVNEAVRQKLGKSRTSSLEAAALASSAVKQKKRIKLRLQIKLCQETAKVRKLPPSRCGVEAEHCTMASSTTLILAHVDTFLSFTSLKAIFTFQGSLQDGQVNISWSNVLCGFLTQTTYMIL